MFGDLQEAISVYSSDELDIDDGKGGDNNVTLKNWLEEGKKKLDDAREALKYLCEHVSQPREVEQYLRYFCGDANDPNALHETEALRISFYKAVVTFIRAFASISQDLVDAGYTGEEIAALNKEVAFFGDTRIAIKRHSGEELDIKPYEADMRHLINTYIQADPADPLGNIDNYSLVELIIETGIHDAIAKKLNEKGKLSKNGVASGIINNVRQTIIREKLTDPRFYEEMSKLLDDLIKENKDSTEEYEKWLNKAEDLAKCMKDKFSNGSHPSSLNGNQRAIVLFNNLDSIATNTFKCPEDADQKATLALKLDYAIHENAPADWRGDETRETQVLNALFPIMGRDRIATRAVFDIIKNQP